MSLLPGDHVVERGRIGPGVGSNAIEDRAGEASVLGTLPVANVTRSAEQYDDSLTSASNAAHIGADDEVPPIVAPSVGGTIAERDSVRS